MNRVDLKGQESMAHAVLMQKITGLLQPKEKTEDKEDAVQSPKKEK